MKKYSRPQEKEKTKNVFNEFRNHLEKKLPISAMEAFYEEDNGNFNFYDEYKTDCDCEYCSFVRNQIIDTEKYVNNINKKSGAKLSEIFITNFFK